MAEPVPPELPGMKILGLLGRGGMGTVWRALDERLGRTVAVKVLAPPLAGEAAFLERFQREARYLARVRHPNLLEVYDAFAVGRSPCLVMECVEGESLARRLARGRLPWPEARGILEAVLGALAAVHAAGLVHRDLKPANIQLDASGRPRVMDFGLAKDASESSLTQEGMILGTPEYLAPEQAKGDPVGAAADVYAVGVIAWEMAAGRAPFKGASSVATLRMQCQDEPESLERVAPEVPGADRAWIGRALRKDPAGRFRDAAEMLLGLQGQGRATPAPAPALPVPAVPPAPAGNRGRRTLFRVAAGLLGLLVALLVLRLRDGPLPRAVLDLGDERVEGGLLSVHAVPGGGHVVTLRQGGRDRAFRVPSGKEAELSLP